GFHPAASVRGGAPGDTAIPAAHARRRSRSAGYVQKQPSREAARATRCGGTASPACPAEDQWIEMASVPLWLLQEVTPASVEVQGDKRRRETGIPAWNFRA